MSKVEPTEDPWTTKELAKEIDEHKTFRDSAERGYDPLHVIAMCLAYAVRKCEEDKWLNV